MASVCVTAEVPDPKFARALLAPFSHAPRDGVTSTSASGFVVLHGGKPVVLAAAAAVYPLLPPHRRHLGSLAGTAHADLVPGAQLAAILPDSCPSSSSGGSRAARDDSGSSSNNSRAAGNTIELRLVGVAELPGVRRALARLLAAPSSAGPAGWQLGWLLQQQGQAVVPAQLSQLPAEQLAQRQPQQQQRQAARPPALSAVLAPPAPDTLAVASHIVVLQAATPAGAQALQHAALMWPGSGAAAAAGAQPGQAITAVGAPFGVLAPQHFTNFLTTGIVSAAVPPSDSGANTTGPAVLLADLRCSPGMEGGPVFAGRPADAFRARSGGSPPAAGAGGSAAQQPPLMGMLLPPLKAPAVHVEWAAVATGAAVAAAAEAVLGPATSDDADSFGTGSLRVSTMSSNSSSGSSSTHPTASQPTSAGAPSAAAAALQGVVAVAAGGSWASGVLVSEAGHVLTNAHLLEPVAAATPSGRGGGSDRAAGPQLRHSPAAARAHAPVQVLLPGPGSGGTSLDGSAAGSCWATADVLYVFQGPLDLAVLKLRPADGHPEQAQQSPQQEAAWCPLRLSRQPPRPGQPVLVAGFPAYSPRSSALGGPLLTAGTLAKVVPLPSSGQPAMLLSSAAVHSGASGGAVVDASTGQLLGLVTSNAKHSSRAGSSGSSGGGGGSGRQNGGGSGSGLFGGSGEPLTSKRVTVLPHLNFSIPAAQLAPVLLAASEAAAAEAAGGGALGGTSAGDAASVAAWRQLDAAGAADAELQQVWRMDPRQRQHQHPQEGSSGAFGGAAPPARLQRLLEQLAERQGQQAQQGEQAQRGQQQPAANLRAKL